MVLMVASLPKFNTLQSVKAVAPVAPWLGGKRLLAKHLISLIEQTPHTLYAEPFIGMGGVFFRREKQPSCEVINDASKDIITLFRVLQRHYHAFVDMLRWQLASRAEFERLSASNPDLLTDLERAARFLFLQKTTFGGKIEGRSFGISYDRPARFDFRKIEQLLANVHERLSSVIIEHLGYVDFIKRYDRPSTLFYLDPPYWGNENDYGLGMFARADFQKLAEMLGHIQGKFILSLNDKPEVRACFKAFNIQQINTTYSLAGNGKSKKVSELIITGQ
jgi:DNA adenine methylase